MTVSRSTNPYHVCHQQGTTSSKHKRYNNTHNTISCCTANDAGATALAKQQDNPTPVTDLYTFLVTLTGQLEANHCDFSTFISSSANTAFLRKNYPILFENASIQMEVYNALYTGDADYNASGLVPTISGKTISCPTNYVPYLVEIILPNSGNTDYISFCSKDSESVITNKLNSIKVPGTNNRIHYNLSLYENNDGSKCKSNTCNTKVDAFLGQATHPEYVSQHEQFSLSDGAIAGFAVLGFFLLVALIIAIYFSTRHIDFKK